MPAINFPSSPTIGQTHEEGGNKWEWTGSTWDLVCDPLPETEYVGVDPIDIDVDVDPEGNKEVTISHNDSTVTPGTYNKLTVDQKGHVTAGDNISTDYIGTAPIGVNVVSDPAGNKDVTISHNNSGVTPGTYNKVTVDVKGHITAAENVDEQNNFVRVLRIPSYMIDFNNDIKDEIAEYISQMNPPLVIDDTDSKWNIVIDYSPQGLLDENTEINVWFDNSGSMDNVLEPLVNALNSCLKGLLLPIYGTEELYEARVKVNTFSPATIPVNGNNVVFTGKGTGFSERTLRVMNTVGSSDDITRVINLVFQDEANPIEIGYHDTPFDGMRSVVYDEDLVAFRLTMSGIRNKDYYKAVIYAMIADDEYYQQNLAFRNFLVSAIAGTGNFSGLNGLSDFAADGMVILEDFIDKSSSPAFYLGTIRQTLISLGFTNIGSVEATTCFIPITGIIVTSCTTSTTGTINVISVAGGSGSGYYFTLNGGATQYPVATGATGIANGSYNVRIYDGAGNNYALGVAVISCSTPLVGTAAASCTGGTNGSGSINVTGVSGGSGTGYKFSLNGGPADYTPGTPVTNLTDGSYTVVLSDSIGSSVSLGTLNIACAQTYNINIYLCGTCTQTGAGSVAYNPSFPLIMGKFYILQSGYVGEVTGMATNPVTDIIPNQFSYWDSCASVPCP
jgi:hypothetical protein